MWTHTHVEYGEGYRATSLSSSSKLESKETSEKKADWYYCKENTRLFVPNEPSYSTSTSTIQISSISPTRKLEDQQSFRITPLFWDGLSPQF